MLAKGVFRVGSAPGPCLIPTGVYEREMLKGLDGKKVLVHVHQARYPEHHRKFFALLRKLEKHTGFTVNEWLVFLKKRRGYVDVLSMPDGSFMEEPRSISFESMGQKEFQVFYDNVIETIKEQVFPTLTEKEYEDAMKVLLGRGE
jgi:Protein of unknown function (DUF1367)